MSEPKEPKEKKPRPRARARKLVPRPPQFEPKPHPVLWVECFGCGDQTRQVIGPLGRAILPTGWVTLYVTDRESKIETPDVYASSDCEDRAARRLSSKYHSERVTVTKTSYSYEPVSKPQEGKEVP